MGTRPAQVVLTRSLPLRSGYCPGAELMVTEPRMPCYKLGIKFGRADIIGRFLKSRRTGFYFAVVKEGEVKAGDAIELLNPDPNKIAVSDITRLYAFEKDNLKTLRRAVKVEALPESWREYFQKQIQKLVRQVSGFRFQVSGLQTEPSLTVGLLPRLLAGILSEADSETDGMKWLRREQAKRRLTDASTKLLV